MGGHVPTAVTFCMHLMALKMIALLLLYMNWDIPHSMDTISNMIFNPLILKDKSNIPLFETDPDIQCYNELSIIYNENMLFWRSV